MAVPARKARGQRAESVDEKKASKQLGLFFDQTRCTGCYSCVVACKDWNDVPPGPASWMKVSTIERGEYPNPFLAFDARPCYHCVNAACVTACPAAAIQKREEDGIVVVDREKCLGKDKCGSPCSQGCPAGNNVRGFIALIREKRYAEAWQLLAETNPLPGVCGRVCGHPCESVCTRRQADAPVDIRSLERFAADYMHPMPPFFTIDRKRQRVAVIGSDPDGLSCAYHLVLQGYRVTVFETRTAAGGMLRDIPESRLPAAVLDREIAFIKALGVEIKTGLGAGLGSSAGDLQGFDAIFVTVAAPKNETPLSGIQTEKIVSGADLLGGQRSGGEGAFSPERIATAIGLGRRAAASIALLLKGLPGEEPGLRQAISLSKLSDTDFIEKRDRVGIPELPSSKGVMSLGAADLDPVQGKAGEEANRCLDCRGMCLVACPYKAPQFGEEENPRMQKCNFCLEEWAQGKKPICVRSCPTRALDAGPLEDLRAQYGNIREAEGFSFRQKTGPAVFFRPKLYVKK